jgi:hypothetical protein
LLSKRGGKENDHAGIYSLASLQSRTSAELSRQPVEISSVIVRKRAKALECVGKQLKFVGKAIKRVTGWLEVQEAS